jgi:putative oxidoreductase
MTGELRRSTATVADEVVRSGIHPASGPRPQTEMPIRGQAELAHPEERRSPAGALPEWPGNGAMLALGRALLGGFFLYNGVNHFVNRQMMAEYARAKEVRAPDAAVLGSGAMILLGGLSVLTGFRPRVGASLIAAFLLGVSPRMHNFWAIEDEQQRMNELVNFSKNMALVGSACLIAAVPEPWPGSLRV